MLPSLILLLVFFFAPIASAAKLAYVVLDGHTGKRFAGKNEEAIIYPASLTKMMTLYLLFESLEKRKVKMNTQFLVSKRASQHPPSKLGLRAGQKICVKDCILAVATKSCNDVTTVVAENLAGSVPGFVRRMNQKARALGLCRTVFQNPTGWHHPAQYTTAKDMGKLIRALWVRFPQYSHFLCRKEFHYQGRKLCATNRLIGQVKGLCMGKTGFTCPAGFSLATLTCRRKTPVVVVVMGAPSGKNRDTQVKTLIERFYYCKKIPA